MRGAKLWEGEVQLGGWVHVDPAGCMAGWEGEAEGTADIPASKLLRLGMLVHTLLAPPHGSQHRGKPHRVAELQHLHMLPSAVCWQLECLTAPLAVEWHLHPSLALQSTLQYPFSPHRNSQPVPPSPAADKSS